MKRRRPAFLRDVGLPLSLSLGLLSMPAPSAAQSASVEEGFVYEDQSGAWKAIPSFMADGGAGIFSWSHIAMREKELLLFAEISRPCPASEPNCTPSGIAAAFDPVQRSWATRNGAGLPAGKRNSLIIQDGDNLLFFGGSEIKDPNVFSRSGSVYSLSGDSWKKMSLAGAPGIEKPKGLPLGGGRFFIWGTAEHRYPLSAGAIYDIASDSWQPVSAKDAPSAAWVTLLVSTGDKILAWGPRSEFGCMGSGAQYNLLSNSWSAISSVDAPRACDEPLVFWDSGKVFVWGGRLPRSDLRTSGSETSAKIQWTNTGGILTAAENRWSPMPLENAPELDVAANSTLGYRAAWTSGKLIIYRFEDEDQVSGYSYSSQTNRWDVFREPFAKHPPSGNSVSFGFDRLQGELTLYALDAKREPSTEPAAFRFPVPPAPVSPSGLDVVRVFGDGLVRVGNSYIFLRTVVRNSESPSFPVTILRESILPPGV